MKAQTLLMAVATLMLIGTVMPLQNASAHVCLEVNGQVVFESPVYTGPYTFLPPTPPADCDPAGCTRGQFHDHTVIDTRVPTADGCFSTARNICPPQWTHVYGSGSSVGADSQTADQGEGVGVVTVWHAGAADCDGDGIPGGWDGDYENGIGGAFFGWGPWADEPICDYALHIHGGNVHVNDVVFANQITFVVGEDDQAGPIFITDPTTGVVIDCETSGSITPDLDNDDCIGGPYLGTGSTCGPGGGDGGFWVFLDGFQANENSISVTTNNPPTSGTITAF